MKQSVPGPPRHLLNAMSKAAAEGNTIQEAMLRAEYHRWLIEQGYERPHRDEVWR